MDLAAEILLQGLSNSWVDLPEIEGNNYGYETRALFSEKMRNELEPCPHSPSRRRRDRMEVRDEQRELAAVLRKSELDPASIVDPWGTPYHYSFGSITVIAR